MNNDLNGMEAIESRMYFFRNLYEHCDLGSNSTIELRILNHRNKWFISPEGFCNYLENGDIKTGYNIYYGVCPRKKGEGGDKFVTEAPAIWCDIDFKTFDNPKQAVKNVMEFPLKPTYVVSTGGGLHCYWKLSEPAQPEDFDKCVTTMKLIALVLQGDMNCTNIGRILRVPYTPNYKYYNEFVEIVVQKNYEYSLEDFEDFLPNVSEIQKNTKVCIGKLWEAKGFIQQVYSNKPYKEGNRNEICTEIIKYYSNNLPFADDIYLHVRRIISECFEIKNDGRYWGTDLYRRIKWGIDHRLAYKVLNTEKVTKRDGTKLELVTIWMTTDKLLSKEV